MWHILHKKPQIADTINIKSIAYKMVDIKQFTVNPLQENCYVVSDDTCEACIIDPGCISEEEWHAIKTYIDGNGLHLVHMLCTHLHFDHIMGCGFVARDYGLDIEGNMADMGQYQQRDIYLDAFGLPHESMPPLPKVHDISSQDTVSFGTHQLKIILTPGHTQGGMCFYLADEGVLFAGDTLFQASIGRTDMAGGDYTQIIRSIRTQLLKLPASTHVLTGHGPSTTIDYEQKFNPYI